MTARGLDPELQNRNLRLATFNMLPAPLTSNDAGKTVNTPAGIGVLQGVATIEGEGAFASVRIANSRVVYELERVSLVDDGSDNSMKASLTDAGLL